jgi:polyisoprenoid-binding protein YceI
MALVAVLAGSSNQADCADYIVDRDRSEFVVTLSKGGIAAALAHNHAIRATEFTGEAVFDPANLGSAMLRVRAQTGSLVADEPDVRRRYGLSRSIGERDRRKIQETMLSASQMNAAKYPTMEFRSTSVEKRPEGQYLVTGNLSIHGVERPVAFAVTLEEEDGALRGRATITFRQSDYGIKPYSAMLGAVRNKDEAILNVEIFAIPSNLAEETE